MPPPVDDLGLIVGGTGVLGNGEWMLTALGGGGGNSTTSCFFSSNVGASCIFLASSAMTLAAAGGSTSGLGAVWVNLGVKGGSASLSFPLDICDRIWEAIQ